MSLFMSLIDGKSSVSSTRFSMLFCTLLSNLTIFTVWTYLSLTKGIVMEFPDSVVYLYAVANGISITGKLVQKKLENGEPDAGSNQ